VKAAQILKKRYPDVNFKLIGPLDSNPSAVKLKELEYWIKEGYVEYLGEVSDVRPYIAGCSVYVLPSYREGMPRTILEAMAMGRPIITTDVPGCRETVDDGFNGFKVKVKDVSSLVEAMEKFILNPSLVKTMGERSRQIAEERYDVDKVNGIILQELGLLDVSLIGKVIHFSEAVNNKNIY
jgi:glycosyltransferase involved in cell wall biosynthesis